MKRVFAMILMVLLCLSLLACGKQEEAVETTQTPETTSATEATTTPAAEAASNTPVAPVTQSTPLQSNGAGCAGETNGGSE